MRAVWKSAIVVGASSGIGEAVARQLAQEGVRVSLVARRLPQLEAIAAEVNAAVGSDVARAYAGDVRDSAECARLFHAIDRDMAGIDLIVYSSGIMPHDAATGYPTEEDIAAIETNISGAVSWLNEAAQYFLDRGHGTIVGIGSIAGDRGRRRNPVYNATKAALEVYLESLRNRLRVHGVNVLTVKPGWIQTPLVGFQSSRLPIASADRAARDILRAARRGRRVIYTPWWWRIIATVLKILPPQVMERLPV